MSVSSSTLATPSRIEITRGRNSPMRITSTSALPGTYFPRWPSEVRTEHVEPMRRLAERGEHPPPEPAHRHPGNDVQHAGDESASRRASPIRVLVSLPSASRTVPCTAKQTATTTANFKMGNHQRRRLAGCVSHGRLLRRRDWSDATVAFSLSSRCGDKIAHGPSE